MRFEYCIIGAGIVGLATALSLLTARPGASLLILEKEPAVALHQTSHNSGVIHAGIYYAPGTLKAKLCRAGLRATVEFCIEHNLPFEQCGKLIVATSDVEAARIDALYHRAAANGVSLERLDAPALHRLEPHITGVAGLLSRETGMVNYGTICQKMAEIVVAAGAEIRLGVRVDHIEESGNSVTVGSREHSWEVKRLVVCSGLQSDRLARLAGLDIDFRIVPFRGEYFQLPASKKDIVRHHIYPAPNPDLPFLGIHITRMIDGTVTVGPNAVIGFAREGYPHLSVNLPDTLDFATFPGFWGLVRENFGHAMHELRGSFFKSTYLEECRKYCPELQLGDLLPFRAGIRAQVVSRDGKAIHDFMFKQTERMLHVCNAPSPAATSALPIGNMIVQRLLGAT